MSTLTVAELAALGAKDLDLWLKNTNSKDALTAMAVTEIALAGELGNFLQIQKQEVDATTKQIKANNDVINLLRKIANSSKDSGKTGTYTKADAAIVNAGVKLAMGDQYSDADKLNETNATSTVDLNKITNWIASCTSYGDQLSSNSQIKQSGLQTSISRYNQAYDLVTSLLKKWSDMQMSTAGNIHQ
jgi:hypothetical protein